MKIKVENKAYADLLLQKEEMRAKHKKHQNPIRPNMFFRTLMRLVSIPDLFSTHFKLERKGMERLEKGQPTLVLMNHSSFIDLVMTGICGIRPSEGNRLTIHPLGTSLDSFSVTDVRYHGHTLAVAWDRTSGLCVTVDGTREYFREAAEDITLEIEL
jgi:hypothetical protein